MLEKEARGLVPGDCFMTLCTARAHPEMMKYCLALVVASHEHPWYDMTVLDYVQHNKLVSVHVSGKMRVKVVMPEGG